MKGVQSVHTGIVIRWCAHDKNKCWVFDQEDGKVCCRVKGQMPVIGAYIHFYIVKSGIWGDVIGNVTTLEIPFLLARHNIYLLHHVFELSYYFLSDRTPAPQTFEFIYQLYRLEQQRLERWWIKVFLFKLLISFGYYPSYAPFSIPVFYRLSIESIDSIMGTPVHLKIERDMDDWLCACVGAHPYFGDFKTVQFLTNLRVP
jgi:hypothetical protein